MMGGDNLSDFAIINEVFLILSRDPTFLDYHNLTVNSPIADKTKKIQKEMEPIGLALENLPLTCIYPIAGVRSRVNDLIYDAMFEIAIYSNSSSGMKTSTIKAGTMLIGQRARELLHEINIGGATLNVEFQTSFQSPSDIVGIKKYVMRFRVGEEI